MSRTPEEYQAYMAVDWFDITNEDHLGAWGHLQEHGVWPAWFKPGDLPPGWERTINRRLAEAYVELMLRSKS